jgi:hypothetical protein
MCASSEKLHEKIPLFPIHSTTIKLLKIMKGIKRIKSVVGECSREIGS